MIGPPALTGPEQTPFEQIRSPLTGYWQGFQESIPGTPRPPKKNLVCLLKNVKHVLLLNTLPL
jgi:hypothetical protein